MIVDTARRTTTRLSTANTDRATLTFLEAAVLVGVCHWSGDGHRSEDREHNNGESHFVDMSIWIAVVSIEFEYRVYDFLVRS